MQFFNSYIGMFLAQTILHSFITVVIIEMSLFSFEIKDHLSRFRYRLLVLTLPLLMFPVFQAINPERGSMYFRENTAILNINRWFVIKIWDIIPLYLFFLIPLIVTSLIFIFQEILPIVIEKKPKNNFGTTLPSDRNADALVSAIAEKLDTIKPQVKVVDASYPLMFIEGTKKPSVIISNHLLGTLDNDQLEGALAHELVHIKRGSSAKTQLIYVIRMLMFYNPISLIEFRRLVQDDEFICDNITVSVTKKPEALASAIKLFYSNPAESLPEKTLHIGETIKSHSYNLLLEERIAELQDNNISHMPKFGLGKFILITIIILGINYMVV